MKMNKLTRAIFRVKIRSLMEEARIIRNEERKCNSKGYKITDRGNLRAHRIGIVRSEQRATLLAYAALRGVPYSVVENPNKSKPVDVKAVIRVCKSLATYISTVDIEQWIKESKAQQVA